MSSIDWDTAVSVSRRFSGDHPLAGTYHERRYALDAPEYVRGLFSEYPPSSPQVALFKGGKVVEVIQRHEIEGTHPEHFAGLLTAVFDRHCG